MPFANIAVSASLGSPVDAGLAPVILTLTGGGYGGVLGLRVDAVRVTGAALIGETSVTPPNPSVGNQFVITIAAEVSTSTMFVDVDLGCSAATTTKHYRVTYLAPAYPTVEELPAS
jgi:hypothetical protein